jgi:hypothetical protein
MSDEHGDPAGDSGAEDRFAVLDVFGLKLEVSNPRLAELLTMDAKEALGTDVRELGTAAEAKELRAEAAEAMPDVVLATPTPKDDQDAAHRRELRQRATAMGQALGFDATPDGLWHSPTSLTIMTRSVDRPVSLAAATHFVDEISARRAQLAGPDSTVLFIVDGQQSADVFKVAVRQRHLYDVMRVITLDNLEEIGRLHAEGSLDHSKALILLTPVANIDVGEILSVIRATSEPDVHPDIHPDIT